jgi:hypothetical protein
VSVETKKAAPATSVFTRDALEEHALRRKSRSFTTNSSNLSRQFLAEEFSSNPLRTHRSSTIFRYVRGGDKQVKEKASKDAKVAHPTKQPMVSSTKTRSLARLQSISSKFNEHP